MSFLFFPWPAAGQLEQALSKCPEGPCPVHPTRCCQGEGLCMWALCSSEHRCHLCAWASRWEGPSSRLALPWALPQAPASRTSISLLGPSSSLAHTEPLAWKACTPELLFILHDLFRCPSKWSFLQWPH